jgi:hypothetical protein
VSPDELRATGADLYGARWIGKLAAALGYRRGQVHRWLNGTSPIPETVDLAVRYLSNENGGRLERPLRAPERERKRG